MEVSRRERLNEFYRRLARAPAAGSFQEARQQQIDILNGVEDELTDIPYDPERWALDGRMYPPQNDSMKRMPEHSGVRRFRSFRHYTYIGENGAIEITGTDGVVEFHKNGRDGRGVWE